MSDEAREAAEDYSPAGVYIAAIKAGYSGDAAHGLADMARNARAAGVAEGIRQAREAVEALERVQEWCVEAGYDLRAILDTEKLPDALVTT